MARRAGLGSRVVKVLVSVTVGATASMMMLKLLYESAFRSEFMTWLLMLTLHSGLVTIVLLVAFWSAPPSLRNRRAVLKVIMAVGVSGLAGLLLTGYGIVLIISGLGFVNATVAVVAYLVLEELT